MKVLFAIGALGSVMFAMASWFAGYSASQGLQGVLWLVVAAANLSHFLDCK